MSTVHIPEWIATLVGRLTLENESMRQALAAQQAAVEPTNGHVSDLEPVE